MKTPETTNERLALYIRTKRIDQEEFANKIGTNRTSLNTFLNGRSGSLRALSRVTIAYPDLNPQWLLSGEGPMLLDGGRTHENRTGYTIPSDEKFASVNEELDFAFLNLTPSPSDTTVDYKSLYEQQQRTIHQLLIKLGEYRGKLELYQQLLSKIK